ncbi:MAG: hypothetical protein JNK14_13510 [Chitinophagaceae bacterium]|nr:hypothetical protein [Chitinophagaceae bacterium]
MHQNNPHIIRSQSIGISFEGVEQAIGIQDRIAELFYERLQPQMETLFNELADKDHLVAIESLEIDAGTLSQKNWEEEWVENTIRSLKAELLVLPKKETDHSHTAQSFFYYLEQGHLPWNSTIRSIQAFEDEIVFNTAFLQQLKALLQRSGHATLRLIEQFPPSFLQRLTDAILKEQKAKEDGAVYPAEVFLQADRRKTQEQILSIFAGEKEPLLPVVINADKIAGKKIAAEKRKNDPVPDKKVLPEKEEHGIYINNAGLIILHPFLPQLFEQLLLTVDNTWVNEEARHKAVLVTSFLVTGVEDTAEFDLPLNKILCGMAPDEPVNTGITIDKETSAVCDELLAETIRHWKVLKNTGIGGLRETFLQRSGKLLRADNDWFLQAERKAVDILLSHLPWGIGVVKMPWMQEMLFTEW